MSDTTNVKEKEQRQYNREQQQNMVANCVELGHITYFVLCGMENEWKHNEIELASGQKDSMVRIAADIETEADFLKIDPWIKLLRLFKCIYSYYFIFKKSHQELFYCVFKVCSGRWQKAVLLKLF